MGSEQRAFLRACCVRQNIVITDEQIEALLVFTGLVREWDRVFNLVASSDFETIVVRHIVDSLSILPYLPQGSFSFLDVGSGAGFPGIPLLIMRPDIQGCLLDAKEKRSVFLSQAILELGLSGVRVLCCRVEDQLPDQKYDLITARAFSSLRHLVTCSAPWLVPDSGCWYAMKGQYPVDEVYDLPVGFCVTEWWPLTLVGENVSRCLLKIKHARMCV